MPEIQKEDRANGKYQPNHAKVVVIGGGLARITQSAQINAARYILSDGDYSDILRAAPGNEIATLLTGGAKE